MKPVTTVVLALGVLLSSSACAKKDRPPELRNGEFSFALDDLDGKRVSSDDAQFEGRVVLVDVWGTWCPPCRQSIPFFEALHEEFADDGLSIVGIAFEEEEDTETRRAMLKAFADEHGVQYTVLDGGTLDDFGESLPSFEKFRGFPTVVILARDGSVAHANTMWVPRELDEVRREVEKALAAPSSAEDD